MTNLVPPQSDTDRSIPLSDSEILQSVVRSIKPEDKLSDWPNLLPLLHRLAYPLTGPKQDIKIPFLQETPRKAIYRVVSKEIAWEAAHRLVFGYPGNCRHVHGHSWRATIVVALRENASLNQYGFVKDYGDFKKLKDWVMDKWDHASLVSVRDTEWVGWLSSDQQRFWTFEGNPSSENIAAALFDKADELLSDVSCKVVEVRVNETCTSETIYRREV